MDCTCSMDGKKLLISEKQYKGDTSVVSARLANEMIRALDDVAEKTGRTRNEIITLCLEFAMENLEIQERKGKKDGK